MAKQSSLKTKVVIGSTDISKDVETYNIKVEQVVKDASGFGEANVSIPGQKSYSVELDMWFNDTNFSALKTAFASPTGTAFSVDIQTGTAGYNFGSGTMWVLDNYNPNGGKEGEAIKIGKITLVPFIGGVDPLWC